MGDTRVNIYSYIVFGDECRLMDIRQNTDNYYVVQRKELLSSVKANAEAYGSLLSDEMIDWYYRELYPYTQVSEEQKMEHAKRYTKGIICKQKAASQTETATPLLFV